MYSLQCGKSLALGLRAFTVAPGEPCWGAPLLSPPRLQEPAELGAHPGSPCSEIQVDSAPLGNTQKTLGLQTSRKLKDWFLGEGAS